MARLSDLAIKLKELRDQKDEIKNRLKEVQTQLDSAEEELLEEMVQEGMNRLDVNEVGNFSIATRKFYKIQDREALMDFLHEQGDVDLLTVNHQTLNAYAKEIAARKEEQGIEDYVVPGVEFTTKTQIRVRKPRR